jgi:glutaredoxin
MVIIYGNQICSYCLRAKALAARYGLDYEWRDTDDNATLNELELKLPNFKTIPQIWWHDKYIGGYEDFATEVGNTMGGFGDGKL